ncbi:MAG: hypothetical protein ABIH04_09225 [Planctomycetota bacterium]
MPEETKGTWRDIFKSFKYAISPQKLLVAFLAIIWFNILNFVFFGNITILSNVVRHINDAFLATFQGLNPVEGAKTFLGIPAAFVPDFPGWCSSTAGKVLYGLLFYLVVWIPAAFFIGVITRISAVQVGRDENVGLKEAVRFASRKYLSFFLPLVLVILAFVVVGIVFNLIIGLVGYIPFVGEILVPLLGYPLAILISLGAVMVIVFGLLGAPLMAPAIGVEGQDSFDALSRSYHYSVQRLGRYVVCLAVLLLFMAASVWFIKTIIVKQIRFVSIQAFQFIPLDREDVDARKKDEVKEDRLVMDQYERMIAAYEYTWPLQANHKIQTDVGDAATPIIITKWVPKKELDELIERNKKEGRLEPLVLANLKLSTGEAVGGFILVIWLKCLGYLVGAFALSFFLTGSTIIYFILRRQIDGAEFDEVYIEGEEEEFEFGEEFEEPAPEQAEPESEGSTENET